MDARLSLNLATLTALAYTLAAAALFTVVFASAKIVGTNADPIQVVFMRYAGAAIVISAIALTVNRGLAGLRSPVPGLHAARAISGVGGEVCIISAPLFMALEDASAINLTGGVFALFLAVFVLKEATRAAHWIAALICLSGAFLIARYQVVDNDNATTLFGVAIALAGAVLGGTELFFIKLLTRHDRPLVIMLYVNVLAVFLLIIPALWVWKPLDQNDAGFLLMLGPMALLAQFCLIRAFALADAVIIVPMTYIAIPMAAVFGYFAFGQELGSAQIIGALLVISGGVLLARLPVRQALPPAETVSSKTEG
ncbi:MAG: DMT family transporter [Pseudomonadota bacterium]